MTKPKPKRRTLEAKLKSAREKCCAGFVAALDKKPRFVEAMEAIIQMGDVVELKSGGPPMTVICHDGKLARCSWLDGDTRRFDNFTLKTLCRLRDRGTASYDGNPGWRAPRTRVPYSYPYPLSTRRHTPHLSARAIAASSLPLFTKGFYHSPLTGEPTPKLFDRNCPPPPDVPDGNEHRIGHYFMDWLFGDQTEVGWQGNDAEDFVTFDDYARVMFREWAIRVRLPRKQWEAVLKEFLTD